MQLAERADRRRVRVEVSSGWKFLHSPSEKISTVINATFTYPDVTTFARLDRLDLEAVRQHLAPDRAVIQCRLVKPDPWCRRYGSEATLLRTAAR